MQIGQNITIGEYWQKVLAIAKTLPGEVTLISVGDNRTGSVGGRVTHCEGKTAAQLIFAGTHREATEDEIAEHEKAQSVLRAQYVDIEYKRNQKNLNLPPEMAAMFTLAVSKLSGEKEKTKRSGKASGQTSEQEEQEQG